MTIWECAVCPATSLGTCVRRSRVDRSICTDCEAELARLGRRRCRRCSGVFPLAGMTTSGKRLYCVACESARRHARYIRHQAVYQARAKTRYQRNRARAIAYQRDYKRAHRETVRAQDRARRQRWTPARRQREYARQRVWRRADPSRTRSYDARWRLRKKLAVIAQMQGRAG